MSPPGWDNRPIKHSWVPVSTLRGRVCAVDLKGGAVFHQGVLWDRFLYMTSPPHSERRHPITWTRLDTQEHTHTRECALVHVRACAWKRPLIWHLVKPIPLTKKAILFLDCLPEPCVWNLTAIWLVGSERRKKTNKISGWLYRHVICLLTLSETTWVFYSQIKQNEIKSFQVKRAETVENLTSSGHFHRRVLQPIKVFGSVWQDKKNTYIKTPLLSENRLKFVM